MSRTGVALVFHTSGLWDLLHHNYSAEKQVGITFREIAPSPPPKHKAHLISQASYRFQAHQQVDNHASHLFFPAQVLIEENAIIWQVWKVPPTDLHTMQT